MIVFRDARVRPMCDRCYVVFDGDEGAAIEGGWRRGPRLRPGGGTHVVHHCPDCKKNPRRAARPKLTAAR